MYHNEGLGFWVECALGDGFWSAGHHVAHVIIRELGGAQGELRHDVSEIRHPFSGGWHRCIGDCAVCCCKTNTNGERGGSLGLICSVRLDN